MLEELIFTTQQRSDQIGLNELMDTLPEATFGGWLDQGIGRLQTNRPFPDIAQICRVAPPIFVRHLCPIQHQVPLTGTPADLLALAAALETSDGSVQPGSPLAVQTRLVGPGNWTYRQGDVTRFLSADVMGRGHTVVTSAPQQVISLVCSQETAYMGISNVADNLSSWPGGERRFAQEPNQISRAEFKLLEALEVFQLDLSAYGNALDLGAAPGGWTRILRRYGLTVVAVDPAPLDSSILGDPRITHAKQTAQEYLVSCPMFDVVTNDMKIDARLSSELMGTIAPRLSPHGVAIVTLKLPHKRTGKVANSALRRLEAWYTVAGARQLFHNRSEITVLLRP